MHILGTENMAINQNEMNFSKWKAKIPTSALALTGRDLVYYGAPCLLAEQLFFHLLYVSELPGECSTAKLKVFNNCIKI
jgi:hypothetical protein